MPDVLTEDQIADELAGPALAGWWFADGALHARIPTGGFAAGVALVDDIAAAADALDHHPDLDLRYTYVDVHTTSHDRGAVTRRDLRLARRITELAAARGLAPQRAS